MPLLNRTEATTLQALLDSCLAPGSYYTIPKPQRTRPLTKKPLDTLVTKGLAARAAGQEWVFTVTLKGVEALEEHGEATFAATVLKDFVTETNAREVIKILCGAVAGNKALRGGILAQLRRQRNRA